jgi:RhtB (resistance to homoserine/threonine) family protein
MPIDPHLFLAYCAACLVLVLTPGPDTAFVLGQSMAGGARRGWLAVAGICAGAMTHTLFAAIGVAALIAASPALFDALRYAGAGYLLWLGMQSLRAALRPRPAAAVPPAPRPGHALLQGMLTNLLNPKVALFFMSFLPQFVAPDRAPAWLQMMLLGLVPPLMALPVFGLVIAAAGRATRLASGRLRRWLEGTAGAIFCALGLRLLAAR